jgi:hypothetical protein
VSCSASEHQNPAVASSWASAGFCILYRRYSLSCTTRALPQRDPGRQPVRRENREGGTEFAARGDFNNKIRSRRAGTSDDARTSREVVVTYGNSIILFTLSTPSYTAT